MDSNAYKQFPGAFSLDGEVALITGGGTGLGFGMAKCMVAAGAKVVIVGRRQEVLDEAVAALGPNATAISQDITELEALPGLVSEVESQVGPLTILVNNAGNRMKSFAIDTTDEGFDKTIKTHLSSSFALAREAGKVMLPRKKGNILFIASIATIFGTPQAAAYIAAKSAMLGLIRSLTVEWAGRGIRINALVPGWIITPMTASAVDSDPERKAKVLSRTPMERMGTPEDVGWAAVYLCSPAAQFVTGTTLVIDGGVAVGF